MALTKRWIPRKKSSDKVNLLSKELGISPVISQILENRKIVELEEVKKFLYPSYNCLYSPFLFNDMQKAVDKIMDCIRNNKKVFIWGDYDVDGVTATTLLMVYFKEAGIENVEYFIPLRFDGYGLNKENMKDLKDRGADLIISVDCGITSIDVVDYANSLGLEVIITDHHEPAKVLLNPEEPESETNPKVEVLPNAVAVIDAKRSDNTYPFRELAGVGVAYKLAVALQTQIKCPTLSDDLRELLDIVAFGSIADIVPLNNENRFITQYGIALLNRKERTRSGFRELIEVAGFKDKEITAGQIGFYLAPRINALGRLTNVSDAVEMFLSEDKERVMAIAEELEKFNQERQGIQETMVEQAFSMLPPPEEFTDKFILLADESWHTGVKGIVASKVLDKYYRPIILCSVETVEQTVLENGVEKVIKRKIASGSGRSIEGFDMKKALDQCSDLLIKYGGHEMAAGVTFDLENLEAFRERLNQYVTETMEAEELKPKLRYEDCLSVSEITFDLVAQLDNLKPFGQGNPSPVFLIQDALVLSAKVLGKGKDHLKLTLRHNGHNIEAIGFYLADFAELIIPEETKINLVVSIGVNEFRGNQTLQLEIKDIQICEPIKPEPMDEKLEEIFKEAEAYLESTELAFIGDKESFHTKVVGVTFNDRQSVIDTLEFGQELLLVRDINNPVDPNAIQVATTEGIQVGFLKAKLAKVLASKIDGGIEYRAITTQINKSETEDKNSGVNIMVERLTPLNVSEDSQIDLGFRESLSKETSKFIYTQIKQKLLGGNEYRFKQLESIIHLMQGKSTLSVMGTGRGKSAIFQTIAAYKAIKDNKLTIILYPLRALVNDQLNSMQKSLSPLGLKVAKATGDVSSSNKEKLWEEINQNKIDVLLTTPEFLSYYQDKFIEVSEKIGYVVIDEGHHAGHTRLSFRPSYAELPNLFQLMGNPVLSIMTATCTDQTFGNLYDGFKIDKIVVDPTIRSNLNIVDKRNFNDKKAYLKSVLYYGDKTIVYVNSREKTVELANELRKELPHLNSKIGFYHAGLMAEDRAYIENLFRDDKIKIIIATSAFGEGVNIPNIKHVIHYHMTFNEVEFNQESGRAGRNGDTAYIHLLFGNKDIRVNDFILQVTAPSKEVLALIYRTIKQHSENFSKQIVLDVREIATFCNVTYPNLVVVDETVLRAVKIFEELKLMKISDSANVYYLSFPETQVKIELENSLLYKESLMDLQEFEEFKQWVMSSSSKSLLNAINRPIYPVTLV